MLYGVYQSGSQNIFSAIDVNANNASDLKILSGVTNIFIGESTIDSERGRIFYKTNLGITVVDIKTGDIINTLSTPNALTNIEFINNSIGMDAIPTMTQWGIFIFFLLLLNFSIFLIRRTNLIKST